jgi:hypothetical protein
MITRYADRVGSGEADELGRMLALHGVLEDALQRAVDGLRNGEPSYSWAEIGRRADMSKQAAQQRWGRETDK